VILDWLQGHSGGLEQVPELRVRGPLTEDSQIGFSLGTVEYNVCNLQSEDNIPSISLQKSKVVLESCNNIARNKTTSFKIPVTLGVYNKKVQTETLVDLEATTNFVNRVVVENNNLVTHKLANPYRVINVDGTPNKAEQITEYVQAYVEIGSHKTY